MYVGIYFWTDRCEEQRAQTLLKRTVMKGE